MTDEPSELNKTPRDYAGAQSKLSRESDSPLKSQLASSNSPMGERSDIKETTTRTMFPSKSVPAKKGKKNFLFPLLPFTMMEEAVAKTKTMKPSLYLFLFLFTVSLTAQKNIHHRWNSMLQTYVSDDGKVNYKDWMKDRDNLDAYIQTLASTPLLESDSKNAKLAYWINEIGRASCRERV